MKKKYSRFRELWAVPKYKILFKLGGWAIFFSIIFILSGIARSMPDRPDNPTPRVSFNRMIENLINNNLRIEYQISTNSEYFIEGTLIDDVIEGTLEANILNRIKIKKETVYIISQGEAKESNILNAINLFYLMPKNIIYLINDHESLIREEADSKIFSFDINNRNISVHINETAIFKIEVFDAGINYQLKYQIIN